MALSEASLKRAAAHILKGRLDPPSPIGYLVPECQPVDAEDSMAIQDAVHELLTENGYGYVVDSGNGRDIINGHPLEALVWLANAAAVRGRNLSADWIVMLGSIVQTKWVSKGDVVAVEIEGLGKASASFT